MHNVVDCETFLVLVIFLKLIKRSAIIVSESLDFFLLNFLFNGDAMLGISNNYYNICILKSNNFINFHIFYYNSKDIITPKRSFLQGHI